MCDTSSGAKRYAHHDCFRNLLFRGSSLDSPLRVIGNAARTLRCRLIRSKDNGFPITGSAQLVGETVDPGKRP